MSPPLYSGACPRCMIMYRDSVKLNLTTLERVCIVCEARVVLNIDLNFTEGSA